MSIHSDDFRTVLIIAMSADGRIAETPGQNSLAWTSPEDRAFFVAKSRELGAVVMGRRTFDTIGRPLKDRLTVVMTREPLRYDSTPGILEFTDAPTESIVADLKKRGFKGLAVAGGASVYGQFLGSGLADELYLTVEPVLFCRGVPVVEGGLKTRLQLKEVIRLSPETVTLRYIIIKED